MGVKVFINLSSPLWNLSRAWACFRNTLKMESGELLLFSSSVANGCVRRSCPVRVLYLFDAASNMAVRLSDCLWTCGDQQRGVRPARPSEGRGQSGGSALCGP